MKFLNGKATLEKYSIDKSIYKIKPKYVVQPKTEQDIIEIINFAKKKKLRITPRGGGTGLSGSAIGKGIIIDFSKHFTKIEKIGSTTIVQPGILINKLRPRVERKGYLLPASPGMESCAIGGNINTRSIGFRSVKYGTIDKSVKALRGVLANGTILDTSKKIPEEIKKKILKLQKEIKKDKQVAKYLKKRPVIAGGYNLKAFLEHKNINDLVTHLLVGSTGTLILMTKIHLKLPKYKPLKQLNLIYTDNFESLQKVMNQLFKMKVSALEFMDDTVLQQNKGEYNVKGAVGALIVGFEKRTSLKKLKALKIIEIKKQEHFWKQRKNALPYVEKLASNQNLSVPSIVDDFSIHPKNFSKVIQEVKRWSEKNNKRTVIFGHIGIGSIHLRPFIDIKKHKEDLDKVGRAIFKIVKKYNGTLVGEHNSGRCRSRYLKMESKKMYSYMRQLKKIFDPKNLLNPKVIFNLDPITKHLK